MDGLWIQIPASGQIRKALAGVWTPLPKEERKSRAGVATPKAGDDGQPQPRLLSREQAADYLGVSVRFLENRAVAGDGPRMFVSGGIVRYPRGELDAWIERGLVSSTSEATQRGRLK